ncbi:MAG: hypothetical protein IPL55_20805 [Saprospiraceae bacterium]|nr:hypothetical protein [Saprospiraceae bacterium]
MIAKALIIINNRKKLPEIFNHLIKDLLNHFGEDNCTIAPTEYYKHSIELARMSASKNIDFIFAIGGDGTFNEVINGILDTGKTNIKLCLIPNGTGNDFCRAQNIKYTPNCIIPALKRSEFANCDVGLATQSDKKRYFLNILDIGFGGCATLLLDRQRKLGIKGNLSYSIAILRTFFYFKKPIVTITTEGIERYAGKLMMLAACNGSTFANGLIIFPGAKPNDEKLGFALLGDVTLWDYLRNIGNLKKGVRIKHKNITYFEGSSISIKINDGLAPIETDGEVFGFGDCDVSIIPNAISILKY